MVSALVVLLLLLLLMLSPQVSLDERARQIVQTVIIVLLAMFLLQALIGLAFPPSVYP